MRRFVVTLLAAWASLSVAGQTLAQAPTPAPGAPTPAPAAPAAVPDQMPFDVPYGAPISADRAAQVVAAAVAEAKKSPRNWKLAIAVVDPNGDLVYFYKMEQTQVASIGIAQGKARTAARYRRPSGAFFTVMQNPAGAYVSTLDPMLVASHGGFPLIEGGKLIGAIGCSGATGDQDAVACKAGADTIK
jgi:glc operon protein GlcG